MHQAQIAGCALAAGLACAAQATFHFMQIEQVIGAVGGDASAQAVQLRMRSFGQNLLGGARLLAHDANGANPVLLIDFASSVPNGAGGARVLVGTAGLSDVTDPPAAPDFVMTNPIPESYLAAGSLTFESDLGTIYWRLSWGGDAYTGSTTGAVTNDDDGDFGPPHDGPLPGDADQAVLFQGPANAQSTTNLADYEVTAAAAVLTNNAGQSFTVNAPCLGDCVGDDGVIGIDELLAVLATWGQSGVPCDLDGGGVGITDFLTVLAVWGVCP